MPELDQRGRGGRSSRSRVRPSVARSRSGRRRRRRRARRRRATASPPGARRRRRAPVEQPLDREQRRERHPPARPAEVQQAVRSRRRRPRHRPRRAGRRPGHPGPRSRSRSRPGPRCRTRARRAPVTGASSPTNTATSTAGDAQVEQRRAAGEVVDPRAGEVRPRLVDVNAWPRYGESAMPGGGAAIGWCGDVWMQNRVTPSASCRSATCLRRARRGAPRPVEDVIDSAPVHDLPYTCATDDAPFRSATYVGCGPRSASNVHIAPIGTSACERMARSSPSCGRPSSSASA